MGHEDRRIVRPAKLVDALGHDAKRVDVQARIGFIENGEPGLEHRHLEDLVPLLLAAGESEIDRAAHDLRPPVDHLELALEEIEEVHRVHLVLAARLAQLVVGGAQEVGVGDAGNLDGVLECQEDAGLRPQLGLEVEQVLAHVRDGAAGHRVGRMSGEHLRQRALAGPVRAHDGMHLAGVDGEGDAPEDFLVPGGSVQILDFEQACSPLMSKVKVEGPVSRRPYAVAAFDFRPSTLYPTLPSRLTPSSFCASTANSIGSSLKTSLQKPFTIIEMAFSVLRPRCFR